MRIYSYILFSLTLLNIACNNEGKDSIEKADSTNQANIDTALTHNMVTLDEENATFLVKAANNGMTEMQLAELAQQKAVSQKIKSFSAMLMHDHSVLNDQIKKLAAQMNTVLPHTIGIEEQKQIEGLMKQKGVSFDKSFMDAVVKNHEATISLYEKTLLNRKDPDINSFADKTLMTLHMHLDSAKSIRSVIK